MNFDLFSDEPGQERLSLGAATTLLRGFALPRVDLLLEGINRVESAAPFRHMVTPGGFRMSVALTNCGSLGWVTDARGYRYTAADPDSGRPWPAMPPGFLELASEAAAAAGFEGFVPDACLVNRYEPGARMSLHQDKNERDFGAPIVSVSLGMPATFQLGGHQRSGPVQRVPLQHGDVVVWGGPDRLRYHGVLALKADPHHRLGAQRLNLTFRVAA